MTDPQTVLPSEMDSILKFLHKRRDELASYLQEIDDIIGIKSQVEDLSSQNARLRADLGRIARQKLREELEEDQVASADFEGAYDAIILIAREALAVGGKDE